VDVRFVTPSGLEEHSPKLLDELLDRDDGFVWVDIPTYDPDAEQVLSSTFHFHDLAVRACRERNHTPSTHAYPDYVFVILHGPEAGHAGHVHLLELDQFIGRRYLVTVHGPLNPAVPADHALAETRAVLRRLESGRFHPASPGELSYALVTALARRQRTFITEVAEQVAVLEQRVMEDDFRSPEGLLEEMFLVRHELQTVRTMAAQSHDVYGRLATMGRFIDAADRPFFDDISDQFARIRSLADGEQDFLYGVIDFYQTRVSTKMTVAVERLAVLAAVTLPITALASVYGMNVIVNQHTHVPQLIVILAIMAVISGVLLSWTKRQGWW
jgi:Mg2+ and Co2+ transporter CorA